MMNRILLSTAFSLSHFISYYQNKYGIKAINYSKYCIFLKANPEKELVDLKNYSGYGNGHPLCHYQ